MPINASAMKSMQSEYGAKKGEQVYYASVNSGKIREAFARSLRKAVRRARGGK